MRDSRARLGMVGAGILLHLLLYGLSIPYSFSWDDRKIVLDSPEVGGRAPLVQAFLEPYDPLGSTERTRGIAYRPVAVASLGLDARLFGLAPGPMRLVNVLLAGAGAGLFGLLVRSLGAGTFVSWSTVVLLSCHPVRLEPVVSISGRSELLGFLFVVGALLARRRPIVSAGLLLLGLSSKENAFAAPALLLLVAAFEPRAPGGRGSGRPRLPLLAAWGGAFALAFAARLLVLGGALTGSASRINPGDNLLSVLTAAGRLAGALSLFPLAVSRLVWPEVLSPDYSGTTFLADELLAAGAVARGGAALAAALGLALLFLAAGPLRRRAPLAGFGLAWALASYLPFANFLFPAGVAFTERILFTPAAGVALAAASLLGALHASVPVGGARRASALLAGVLLALLGSARLFRSLPDWRDDRALMEGIVRDLPRNSKAWWNLTLLSLGEGRTQEAARCLRRTLALDPNYRAQGTELVRHAGRIGRRDQAEALAAAMAAPSGTQRP